MAQRRMISKSISTSKKVNRLEDLGKVLYTWLIPHCDDYGHMDGDAATVKAIVAPLVDCSLEAVERQLAAMETLGLIARYQVAGEVYLEISNFEEFQTFKSDRPKWEKYPQKETLETSGNQRKPVGSFVRDKLSKDKLSKDKIPFLSFWDIYPRKVEKKKSQEKWERLEMNTQELILLDIRKRVDEDDQWKRGYIPYPTTYLNGERWEDEIIKPRESKKVERKVDSFK